MLNFLKFFKRKSDFEKSLRNVTNRTTPQNSIIFMSERYFEELSDRGLVFEIPGPKEDGFKRGFTLIKGRPWFIYRIKHTTSLDHILTLQGHMEIVMNDYISEAPFVEKLKPYNLRRGSRGHILQTLTTSLSEDVLRDHLSSKTLLYFNTIRKAHEDFNQLP